MITFFIGVVLWVATAVAWCHCLRDIASYDKYRKHHKLEEKYENEK